MQSRCNDDVDVLLESVWAYVYIRARLICCHLSMDICNFFPMERAKSPVSTWFSGQHWAWSFNGGERGNTSQYT